MSKSFASGSAMAAQSSPRESSHKVCKFYLQGTRKSGGKCKFVHHKPCRFFNTKGGCVHGQACVLPHAQADPEVSDPELPADSAISHKTRRGRSPNSVGRAFARGLAVMAIPAYTHDESANTHSKKNIYKVERETPLSRRRCERRLSASFPRSSTNSSSSHQASKIS